MNIIKIRQQRRRDAGRAGVVAGHHFPATHARTHARFMFSRARMQQCSSDKNVNSSARRRRRCRPESKIAAPR